MAEFQKWWVIFSKRYTELNNPYLCSIAKEFCYQAWLASRAAIATEDNA